MDAVMKLPGRRYVFILPLLQSAFSVSTLIASWTAENCSPYSPALCDRSGHYRGMGNIAAVLGGQQPLNSELGKFDVLVDSVSELQGKLQSGALTSVEMATKFLDQIDRHNYDGMEVRAIISVAPRESVLAQARLLDQERLAKGTRGPMHGIPVLVKDTFWTHPSLGMDTTCGTVALRGAKPRQNAAVVDTLIRAGMIIIGKANLSELALMKGSPPLTAGWSSAGGQGKSPYVRGGVLPNATFLGHSTPCGSSSGSAAGVAAGFAPISIGHETDGSIVQAATRAALYALKPSVGTVPLDGTMPVSTYFDILGGMARTPQDLADITGIVMGGKDFSKSLKGSWKGLSIGFVDPDLWQPAPFVVETQEDFRLQTYREIDAAIEKITAAGGEVVRDVPLITLQDIAKVEGGDDPDNMFGHGFKSNLEGFLQNYEESPVRTLQEMVDFNKAHADVCLPPDHPSQGTLEAHLTIVPDPDFEKKLGVVRSHTQDAIRKMLLDYKLDAVVGPADARMASVASAAGMPVGSMPLGFADFNGRAWGLNIITGTDGEARMLEVMSAWATTFPDARKPPPILVDWKSENAKI